MRKKGLKVIIGLLSGIIALGAISTCVGLYVHRDSIFNKEKYRESVSINNGVKDLNKLQVERSTNDSIERYEAKMKFNDRQLTYEQFYSCIDGNFDAVNGSRLDFAVNIHNDSDSEKYFFRFDFINNEVISSYIEFGNNSYNLVLFDLITLDQNMNPIEKAAINEPNYEFGGADFCYYKVATPILLYLCLPSMEDFQTTFYSNGFTLIGDGFTIDVFYVEFDDFSFSINYQEARQCSYDWNLEPVSDNDNSGSINVNDLRPENKKYWLDDFEMYFENVKDYLYFDGYEYKA